MLTGLYVVGGIFVAAIIALIVLRTKMIRAESRKWAGKNVKPQDT